jgi:hypothetical protein
VKNVRGLILVEKIFNPLTIRQIALNELHIFQLRKRIGMQPVSADNAPTFRRQKPDHVRANESLGTSHKRSFLHSGPRERFDLIPALLKYSELFYSNGGFEQKEIAVQRLSRPTYVRLKTLKRKSRAASKVESRKKIMLVLPECSGTC